MRQRALAIYVHARYPPVCVETKQSSRPSAHACPFKYRVTCDAHYTFCLAICIQSGAEFRRENAARRCVNRITTTGANKFQPSPLTSLSTPLCSSVLFRPRSQHIKEKCSAGSCVDRRHFAPARSRKSSGSWMRTKCKAIFFFWAKASECCLAIIHYSDEHYLLGTVCVC